MGSSGDVVWRLGDSWRDLRSDLAAVGDAVTVVSEHGTARVLAPEGWQLRVPLEGGHRILDDSRRHPLGSIVSASPCGVHTTDGVGGWHHTTPLILVVVGVQRRWLELPSGRAAFETVMRTGWSVTGHPPHSCGAAYCIAAE